MMEQRSPFHEHLFTSVKEGVNSHSFSPHNRGRNNFRAILASEGIEITDEPGEKYSGILSIEALRFVAQLSRLFCSQRDQLLLRRKTMQERIDKGVHLTFLPETGHIRSSEWNIAPTPRDLSDRRVEITGPADDAKMVINAFNSGANVYMADFEDAMSPRWENVLQGQLNLRWAVEGNLIHVTPEGKKYSLNAKRSTLMVRPRGWHLSEKHMIVDGKAVPASLFDFGLFVFHNANPLLNNGTGPYFYLPKIENHLEARLWNDIFLHTEHILEIPVGSIKATVLIETILAAFEMDEILYELREHSAGLNCGRWDYIFSFIKKFRNHSSFVLPDRKQITMDKGFLSSYVNLLIKTCHRRGAHAMGGMAANIPNKYNETANAIALKKVREDKEREVRLGHDGTWVAHPGLVPIAKEIFDSTMLSANQLDVLRNDFTISAQDLTCVPSGEITEEGLRNNIDIGIRYVEAWLNGKGAVPLYNLMEDAATAEISRAQIWQWIRHAATMSNGKIINRNLVKEIIQEELLRIKLQTGKKAFHEGKYILAAMLFEQLVLTEQFIEFLTLPAYDYL